MGHLPNFLKWFIVTIGYPAVFLYHALLWNPFLNVAAVDGNFLEEVGNQMLSPLQYLCVGKVAIPSGDPDRPYEFERRFDYNADFVLNTAAAALTLPAALPCGSLIKGLSYLFPDVRKRHKEIAHSMRSTAIRSNKKYYEKIGLNVGDFEAALPIDPPAHIRRPGSENHLMEAKIALREIGDLLQKHGIPYWVDCGSCLGAYRYGGVIPWDFDVDMGILAVDSDNVWHVLQELDSSRYQVQNWSSRYSGAPLLKVYLRGKGQLIDIFHYVVDEEKGEIYRITANEDSRFLSDKWRDRESRYCGRLTYQEIFPLKVADFDGIKVPVPCETKRYLQSKYGENIEPARIYSEETGEYEKDLHHPYWERVNVY